MLLELGLNDWLVERLSVGEQRFGLSRERLEVDPRQLLAELEHRAPAELPRDCCGALVHLELERHQLGPRDVQARALDRRATLGITLVRLYDERLAQRDRVVTDTQLNGHLPPRDLRLLALCLLAHEALYREHQELAVARPAQVLDRLSRVEVAVALVDRLDLELLLLPGVVEVVLAHQLRHELVALRAIAVEIQGAARISGRHGLPHRDCTTQARRRARARRERLRIRRSGHRASRGLRRVRPRRRAWRPRAGARHALEARLCRGDPGRRAGAELGAHLRGCSTPGRTLGRPALRAPARGEGAPGARGARALRRLRGAARRADRRGGADLALPQQARVLVWRD